MDLVTKLHMTWLQRRLFTIFNTCLHYYVTALVNFGMSVCWIKQLLHLPPVGTKTTNKKTSSPMGPQVLLQRDPQLQQII